MPVAPVVVPEPIPVDLPEDSVSQKELFIEVFDVVVLVRTDFDRFSGGPSAKRIEFGDEGVEKRTGGDVGDRCGQLRPNPPGFARAGEVWNLDRVDNLPEYVP